MNLYQHQLQGLKDTQEHNKVAYYWDMGTGKTFIGAEKMKQLGSKTNLIICQKSKIGDWINHFTVNYPEYEVFNLTANKKDEKRRNNAILLNCKYKSNIPCVLVINYELAWRKPELLDLSDFTLLLDESSLIQNENAKRSKFILKLQPKNVILLSGTPTGGKYENLWSQLRLLGWDISKRMYLNQYVNIEYMDMMGKSIPIVTGYKNVNRLKRKMRDYGCRFLTTEEVIDLPEQVFIDVKVDTTKDYKDFMRDSIVTVENKELVGDTTLTKLLYARQLCSVYNDNRYEAFKDLLNSTEDGFVVFYNFNAELENIKAVCDSLNRSYVVVNGENNGLEGYNYSENYETLNSCIIICQYQAAAYGLNLQYANRLIFYSLPLSSELFEQSKKRIHRIGQSKTCFYYLMMCRNSVEEKILKNLKQRKDYTTALFERG